MMASLLSDKVVFVKLLKHSFGLPPLPPRRQQPKTAGANLKLDKTWGQRQTLRRSV